MNSGEVPRWISPDRPPPERWEAVGDQSTASAALALARKGRGLLYQGGYNGARQLLSAMGRRLRQHPFEAHRRDRVPAPARREGDPDHLRSLFLAERDLVRVEHEVLSRLVVPVGDGYRVELGKAPDVRDACEEALGPFPGTGVLPLRDLLGMVGAHEWRRKGVEVAALGARVHPHYGVFAPVRGEYVELVARAAEAWPVAGKRAVDVGTGTGVLAFVLARRGASVVATDVEPRAVACARENAARLGLAASVDVRLADLFPGEPADLVVSNPPWLPADAHGPLDRAVYDPGGAMLAALVAGLPAALRDGGEAWIVGSDLAERLGLRPPGQLEAMAARAGVRVADALEVRPTHPRTRDRSDPLQEARAAEVVRLVRLAR
jgi:SAM-dependent methyltransferase